MEESKEVRVEKINERVYTPEEVARHNTQQDLWIVIHKKVHDLTSFVMNHPGGEEVLINLAGQDGTECFDEIGHTIEAKKLCESFCIGELSGNMSDFNNKKVFPDEKNEPTIGVNDKKYQEPKYQKASWWPYMTIGFVIYAIIMYFLLY